MKFEVGQVIMRKKVHPSQIRAYVITEFVDNPEGGTYRGATLFGDLIWFDASNDHVFCTATLSFAGPVPCGP